MGGASFHDRGWAGQGAQTRGVSAQRVEPRKEGRFQFSKQAGAASLLHKAGFVFR